MHYFLLLALFTLFHITPEASEYEVITNKATLPLLTPSLANAKTMKIRLSNGLEAYLFSDPEVDKSSAGLTVLAGSWDEPEDHPGLAHFLEHMLFLGTHKYPKEGEYNRYISEHDGQSNAFTSDSSTSYMFSIDNKAFPVALDRFSSFFKEPLFNPSGVDRELHAIDQEYAKNLDNDDFRELFVLKDLADPMHPFHRFNIGNTSTLSEVSQETLQNWYRTHYSSNLMRLAVISPLPLDELRDLVVADFKDVPNLNRPLSTLNRPLFNPQLNSSGPSFVYIEPVKNVRKLSLVWDMPSKFAKMQDANPPAIICYVLGHEGKGSLLADLKSEKLAESLSCGSFPMGQNNLWLSVDIGLTDEGLKQINTVIERCFQAIARFKEKGVPQYLFDEVKQLATIHYEYQPRDDAFDTIMRYSSWLAREKMETFPQLSQVIERFDPEAVKEALAYMTPQNCHFDIIAPATLTGVPFNKKEPWMDVKYAVKPIPPQVLKTWQNAKPISQIDLPAPNPYIPQNLDLVHAASEASTTLLPTPKLIVDSPKAKIYFASDSKFKSPIIGWIFDIRTPSIVQGNAKQVVLADLFIKGLKEMLDDSRYPASLAGIGCEINRNENGMTISIDGYNDKASLLLSEVLKKLTSTPYNEQQFKVYKASLARQYQNFGKDNPISLASQLVMSVLYQRYTTDKEKAAAIRKITYDQYLEFVQGLFSKVYVQGMLYGNMTEAQANEISETLIKALPGGEYPKEQRFKPEVIVLEDKGPFYVDVKMPSKGNITWLTIQAAPPFSLQKRAAQQVIMQDIYPLFFDDLRTKQQTGYLVYSGSEELERKLFGFFTVQSDTHDNRDLLARFELFLERYLQELPFEFTETRLNTLRSALIESLKQSALNTKDMTQLLNLLAFKYDGDFEWIDKRIASLAALTYEECREFAYDFLSRQNKRRIAVMLNGEMALDRYFHYARLNGIPLLRKQGKYEPRTMPK